MLAGRARTMAVWVAATTSPRGGRARAAEVPSPGELLPTVSFVLSDDFTLGALPGLLSGSRSLAVRRWRLTRSPPIIPRPSLSPSSSRFQAPSPSIRLTQQEFHQQEQNIIVIGMPAINCLPVLA